MSAEVRCANPSCGRPTRLGFDALGRTFRCPRCGTKLPKHGPGVDDHEPWEAEELPAGRTLGVALPTRFGRYEVRGLLGSGACAAVYRAFDPELQRQVALKVPHAAAVAGPASRERFLGEARALARLRHPGIVPAYDAGSQAGVPYLATALIEGPTLAEVLRAGPLGFLRAAGLAADLAAALDHAHGSGVVHRDVKPANVLIEPDGSAHLTDFGLARGTGRPGDDGSVPTRPGGRDVISGTPAYVAPEQAEGGPGSASPAGDQYSLGVVLYEMLCGRPPHLGPPAAVLYAACYDDPIPPRVFRPSVPRALERICLKAMDRDPGQRYPSCSALADDLRRWSTRAQAVSAALGSVDRASGWARRRHAAALSTLLAVVGMVATTVFASALVASTALAPVSALTRTGVSHAPSSLGSGPANP
jgi:serine/threonine protein kinase